MTVSAALLVTIDVLEVPEITARIKNIFFGVLVQSVAAAAACISAAGRLKAVMLPLAPSTL